MRTIGNFDELPHRILHMPLPEIELLEAKTFNIYALQQEIAIAYIISPQQACQSCSHVASSSAP